MNPFRSIFLFTYAFSSKKKNSLLFNAPKNFREKRETRKNRYTCWSNKWNNSFSRNQYDGLNTKATKKSKQTTESLYYKKKKHFSLIYFPPPFTFIAVKLVSTFFFFFSLSPVSKHPVQRQNLFHSDESNRFFSINTRINT